MSPTDKLYIVTREDLPPGSAAVQAMHAAIQFMMDHPLISRAWFEESNYLAFLSIRDEPSLEKLVQKAESRGIIYSIFREPDLGNQITAAAFEPGIMGRRLCSNLKLALNKEDGCRA